MPHLKAEYMETQEEFEQVTAEQVAAGSNRDAAYEESATAGRTPPSQHLTSISLLQPG